MPDRNSRRPPLYFWVVTLGVVAAMAYLISQLDLTRPPAEPDLQRDPLTYPNARQVTTESPTPSPRNGAPLDKVIMFVTPDKPDTVLSFYRERFKKDGWTQSLDVTTGGEIEFYSFVGDFQPRPFRRVIAVQTADGGSSVRIELGNYPAR